VIIEGVTAERLLQQCEDLVLTALLRTDPAERAQIYTNIMDTARALGIGDEIEEAAQSIARREHEPELWELPEPFEKPVELQSFPVSVLPETLADYLREVARTVQVYPEMCVLPLLSTLALCVQGKAVIQFPYNDHTEPLNLYTVTVAAPGQRKTSCYSSFFQPVEMYVKRYNAEHAEEIKQNQAERASLKERKAREIKQKNPDFEKIADLIHQLEIMETLNELKMNVTDVTPEALAWELYQQHEHIGILDDEGSVFDVLGGMYSNGASNIGIFLKAYDGASYSISRRTKEDINLENPLLAIGLMTQPDHVNDIMSNKQFRGRGLIHRFLFSFPKSRIGEQTLQTGEMNQAIKLKYFKLIDRLLRMPYPEPGEDTPTIMTGSAAAKVLSEYFENLQSKQQQGGIFETLTEWASKHFARCMRTAAILHLCEHGAADLMNEQTALAAINISMWAENHALKALQGEMTESQEVKDAKYILSRCREQHVTELSKRELLRLCQRLKADEMEYPLELLEDMRLVKRDFIQSANKGRPLENIKISPFAF
jgi:hypothetical protein